MPYCPNCKAEFVDGVTLCSDCHVPLVDTLEETSDGETPAALEDPDCLSDPGPSDPESEKEILLGLEQPSVYVSSKDRYEELRSSGSSLLIVGLLLCALLAVNLSGVIDLPISSSSRILTSTVIGLLALGCLLGAHSTFRKGNLIRSRIASEQRQREQMIDWCVSTYDASHIDKVIQAAEPAETAADSMEVLCLKRMEMIKTYLTREYEIADEAYLDDLSEEIYQKIFES